VLPEQGQSLAMAVRSRAVAGRHGASPSSARTWHPGHEILRASGGHSPALVATAVGIARPTCRAVATTYGSRVAARAAIWRT
jgi:hypothetical protein